MKITTLKENPNLYNEVIKMIEISFSYTSNNSYAVDFAPLMTKENWHNCHLLIDGENVVGHIGACPRILGDQHFETPVVLFGGIALNPDYRGKGLFSEFFNNVTNIYKNECALLLLWSDLSELYEKFDFYEIGNIQQIGKNTIKDIEGFESTKLNKLNEKDIQAIKDLYNSQLQDNFLTIKRNNADWEILKSITSSNLYIQRDSQGTIKNYFFCSKGEDLTNIIHECSFNKELEDKLKDYPLWVPRNKWQEDNIFLGFIKIANQKLFTEFIHNFSKNDILIKDINGNIDLEINNESHTLERKVFLQGVFGPNFIEEFQDLGKQIYISGLDSI